MAQDTTPEIVKYIDELIEIKLRHLNSSVRQDAAKKLGKIKNKITKEQMETIIGAKDIVRYLDMDVSWLWER